ncbi:MAG TPA: hypothetical protein VGQ00_03555 [Candidatus Norongarragalinales archaeon]|jgi:hypothetical protein|nr:hypothetical protein [Candidatus Norongarragalinales archaeon]
MSKIERFMARGNSKLVADHLERLQNPRLLVLGLRNAYAYSIAHERLKALAPSILVPHAAELFRIHTASRDELGHVGPSGLFAEKLLLRAGPGIVPAVSLFLNDKNPDARFRAALMLENFPHESRAHAVKIARLLLEPEMIRNDETTKILLRVLSRLNNPETITVMKQAYAQHGKRHGQLRLAITALEKKK